MPRCISVTLSDTGHQCYTHKILTGRRNKIHTLRQFNGLAGFLKRDESPYDAFGAGHAGTALSAKKENLVEALLVRCHMTYGDRYREIINGTGTAPEKLRRLAAVFAGLLSW